MRDHMIIFSTQICRDGYQLIEEDGDLLIQAKSDNFEKVTPIPKHWTLFRMFADIGQPKKVSNPDFKSGTSYYKSKLNIDGILRFIEGHGLLTAKKPGEAETLHHWDVALESMNAAIKCWQKQDFETLVNFFDLDVVAKSTKKLTITPAHEYPQINDVAPTLLDALWAQFAMAISKNETQLRCSDCKTWFVPKRKRTEGQLVFCSPKCQKHHQYMRNNRMKKESKK
jgi:hypothetical protein